MKVTVALIIAMSVLSFLSGLVYAKGNATPLKVREALLLIAPFLFIFTRTFITDRSGEALFYLEVSMSLLAFPAIFFFNPLQLDLHRKNLLNLLFVLSTLVITVYGEFKSAVFLFENMGVGKKWTSIGQLMDDPSFAYYFRTVFEESTGIHPTYACVFIGISILLTLDYTFRNFRPMGMGRKVFFPVLMVILLILQVQLASRTPFLATLAAAAVLIFFHMRKKIYALYVMGAVALFSIVLMLMVPAFSLRIREVSLSNTSMPSEGNENSFNIRVGIMKCSTELIGENWLWGVGPGNVQERLNTCYDGISRVVYGDKNYNTHNQFLDYWAGLGIAGPVLLLAILVYMMVANYRRRVPVAIALAVFFIIAMMTENLLNRQNGIVAFAYFVSLYFFSATTPEDPHNSDNQPINGP